MPVVRRTVFGLILRHRRDADAVGEFDPAHAVWNEHRRPRRVRLAAGRALLEPFFGARDPLGIALTQILMADSLRAGKQRIIELYRVEMEVALDVLEPLGRVARGVLQPQHFEPTFTLVALERGGQGWFGADVVGERDGAFHRELGAGSDRKMRSRRGVTQQHDVLIAPARAEHAVEIEPGRAAQMTRVRHQSMATESARKNTFAGGDAFI